jgi:predicted DsbA family dithiol-disulfide isomerase
MKVDVWSDIACPFCYIGHRRLEWALEQVGFADEVEVVYHSFQLDARAPVENAMRTTEMLARKYGMSEQQAQQMNERMMEQARDDGLELRLLDTQLTNTGDAHRVIHLAKAMGKEPQVVEQLFRAYFTESRHVGRRESLVQIAVEAGLAQVDVEAMLASERFVADVRADQEAAHQLGVQGVPFYVFDNKFAVSGAQARDVFRRALEQAYADRAEQVGQGDSCNSDGCEI